MSYILDALKRAESERSRGAIPNIHAQPGQASDGGARGLLAGQPAVLAVVVGVLLAAAAAWWMSADTATPPAVVVDAVPSTSPAVPPATVPATVASMPMPALAARLPAAPVGPVPTAPAKPIVLPWLAQKVVPLPASPSTRLPTAAAASSANERVYTLKELPDNIRSSLPVLTVGGATYSDNAASRMLIVNGNLFHEGDKLTPDLTLHQIKLRAAVLSFRGYRYSISY